LGPPSTISKLAKVLRAKPKGLTKGEESKMTKKRQRGNGAGVPCIRARIRTARLTGTAVLTSRKRTRRVRSVGWLQGEWRDKARDLVHLGYRKKPEDALVS
jgi:hypothetical protein